MRFCQLIILKRVPPPNDAGGVTQQCIVIMYGRTYDVKEQTFDKRSTNVPISNRNETKNDWVRSRICLIAWDHFYLVQESIFWTKSKQSVFKKRNDTKTFWFRFQNNIGTFVLSFLTLLDVLFCIVFRGYRINLLILFEANLHNLKPKYTAKILNA